MAAMVGDFGSDRTFDLLLCGMDDALVHLAHGADVVRADVEEVGFAVAGGLNAGGGEIFGVDELIVVVAFADNPDGFVVVDELVQNCEQTEPARVHDGGAADHDDVEVRGELLQELLGGELGFAVELDGRGNVALLMNGMAEIGGPQTVRGDEDEGADSGGTGGLCEQTRGIDVGGPEQVLVHLHAVGELRSDMIDSVEAMLSEGALEKLFVAEVALNAREAGESVFVRLEIDIDDSMALAQKTAFEHAAEEARTTCHQNMCHG